MIKKVEFLFQKNNKSIVFYNKRDTVSFIESCCGHSTAIQNEANKEAIEKKQQQLLTY